MADPRGRGWRLGDPLFRTPQTQGLGDDQVGPHVTDLLRAGIIVPEEVPGMFEHLTRRKQVLAIRAAGLEPPAWLVEGEP